MGPEKRNMVAVEVGKCWPQRRDYRQAGLRCRKSLSGSTALTERSKLGEETPHSTTAQVQQGYRADLAAREVLSIKRRDAGNGSKRLCDANRGAGGHWADEDA
jgi:hypothetical protein